MSESSEETVTSEPSEETTVRDIPPQENPPPNPNNYSFYVKMKPLRTLKRAIEVLLDPSFKNDRGFGLVGADEESLTFSVKNNDNAIATLLLKSTGLIEFQNYVPPPRIIGLLAPLNVISQSFPRDLDGDDDTVIIFYVQGSNRLCFKFGTVPPTDFWAEIVEVQHLKMLPRLTVITRATVPADDMRDMIDFVLQAQDLTYDTVFINWKPHSATFENGSDITWNYDYREAELTEATGLRTGQTYQSQFNWSYASLIKEASFLTEVKVGVHFLSAPEEHILFTFDMGELADFLLLKKRMC